MGSLDTKLSTRDGILKQNRRACLKRLHSVICESKSGILVPTSDFMKSWWELEHCPRTRVKSEKW